jgi:hypothetical protein
VEFDYRHGADLQRSEHFPRRNVTNREEQTRKVPSMKSKLTLAAAMLCGGILAADAQTTRNPTGESTGPTIPRSNVQPQSPNQAGTPGAGSVSAQTHCWDRTSNQARMKTAAGQSGGTGSPVAGGSQRGSTDRANPSTPSASGPAGQGTTGSGNTMGLAPC